MNFTAAYTRRGPPQTPMIRYIGTSIPSQNTKKRKRSRATKTPSIPVSRRHIATRNSFTRVVICVHDARMQSGARSVVKRTRSRLIPSTPR